MKAIGKLTERNDAELFVSYLHAIGIESRLDPEDDGLKIWVYDLDNIPQAAGELDRFRAADDRSSFEEKAKDHREQEIRSKSKEIRQRKAKLNRPSPLRPFADQVPVTMILAAACAAIFVFTEFGRDRIDFMSLFKISDAPWVETLSPNQNSPVRFSRLPEVSDGQVWRLWTPIFLHGDFMHVFFNVLWLIPLGSAIEYRRGTVYLLAFVLAVALVSNLAQFTQRGPNFVGISGVVSALFGFVLVVGKFSPEDGIGIDSRTAVFMLLFLGICMTDLIPNAANWAHMVGLGMGAGIGALDVGIRRALRR